jgi:copper chaperone CopZ
MNIISKISAATLLLFSFSSCNAQIKNAKTESVKIYGNCEMCEKTIETAGNIKKVASVDWNKDSKMATITYDSTKTNQDEILKLIALVGYDSDKFLAPDDVYNKLAGCCQYERINKKAIFQTELSKEHSMHNQETEVEKKQEVNQLKTIFENYFTFKDASVKSDGKLASTLAKDLLVNINAIKMDKLSQDEHIVWMKVLSSLKSNTEKMLETASVEKQRIAFMDLSAYFYDLLKVSKQENAIYYQNCPMYNDGKGANWLSKESTIKNPYYGSQMLTCGKTVETSK